MEGVEWMTMYSGVIDRLKDSKYAIGLAARLGSSAEKAKQTPLGRELYILADSVSRQLHLNFGKYSIDDVFRDPRRFTDPGIDDIGSRIVDKSHDFDLRFSLDRFAEYIYQSLRLSFVGAYIRTDAAEMSGETDRESGNFIAGRTANLDERIFGLKSPELSMVDGNEQLCVPFTYRGLKYGAAVFEKHSLSKRDIAALIYCSSQFSKHLLNSKTGYAWRKAALTDHLTGLRNRRCFEHSCTRMIKHSQKSGKPLSLLFMDLDHFKRINDMAGHGGGDRILKQVADVLRANFRERDIARYGGEEFVVAMPDTSYNDAHHRARKFGISLTDMPYFTKISATIGVASTDRDVEVGGSIEDSQAKDILDYLLNVADKRLYGAKTFRNAVFCIDDDSLTGFPNVTTLGEDIKKHLEPGERANSDVAIFIFNVKGMTDMIRQYGHDHSWGVFRDSVVSLNGENSEFDVLARVHNRDEVIAYCHSNGDRAGFSSVVESKANKAIELLSRPQGGHASNPLNFVLGVTVYSPLDVDQSHALKIAENPNIILGYAQSVADDAKNSIDNGFVIRKYQHRA